MDLALRLKAGQPGLLWGGAMGYRTAPWDWSAAANSFDALQSLLAAAHDVTGDGGRETGGHEQDAAQQETQPNGNRGFGGEALTGYRAPWVGGVESPCTMYDALIMYRIRIMMKMLILADRNSLMLLVRRIMEFHRHGKQVPEYSYRESCH